MSTIRFKPKEWAAFVAERGIIERDGEAVRPFKRRFGLPKPRFNLNLPRSIALWWFVWICALWNIPLALYSLWWCLAYSSGVIGGLVLLKLRAARGSKAADHPCQSRHIE